MDMLGGSKVSKRAVEGFLCGVVRAPAGYVTFERLSEQPSVWKHACVEGGVVELQSTWCHCHSTIVYFAVCLSCAKVLYHYED